MAKSGIWKRKEDGEIVFQETDFQTKGVSEFTPEQMGLTKQAEFDVYFLKETENPDEWENKTKTFFCQKIVLRIREAYNLWLKLGDNRQYFITDILNGQTIRAPFESDNTLIVEKSKPKKVSVEAVREAKKTAKAFYFYGMVSGSDPQNLEYGTSVSA